jgi:hypothetical protein
VTTIQSKHHTPSTFTLIHLSSFSFSIISLFKLSHILWKQVFFVSLSLLVELLMVFFTSILSFAEEFCVASEFCDSIFEGVRSVSDWYFVRIYGLMTGSRNKILVSGGTSYPTFLDSWVPLFDIFSIWRCQPRSLKWMAIRKNIIWYASRRDLSIGTSIDPIRILKWKWPNSGGHVLMAVSCARKPRRPSLVKILCRAWTGTLIDWGSAELLPDRSQLTVKAPCCNRGLLVYHDHHPVLHSCFYAVSCLLSWMVNILVP